MPSEQPVLIHIDMSYDSIQAWSSCSETSVVILGLVYNKNLDYEAHEPHTANPIGSLLGEGTRRKLSRNKVVSVALLLLLALFLGSVVVSENYAEEQCQRYRPRGSEPLPRGIVQETSNLEMRPLWGVSKRQPAQNATPFLVFTSCIHPGGGLIYMEFCILSNYQQPSYDLYLELHHKKCFHACSQVVILGNGGHPTMLLEYLPLGNSYLQLRWLNIPLVPLDSVKAVLLEASSSSQMKARPSVAIGKELCLWFPWVEPWIELPSLRRNGKVHCWVVLLGNGSLGFLTNVHFRNVLLLLKAINLLLNLFLAESFKLLLRIFSQVLKRGVEKLEHVWNIRSSTSIVIVVVVTIVVSSIVVITTVIISYAIASIASINVMIVIADVSRVIAWGWHANSSIIVGEWVQGVREFSIETITIVWHSWIIGFDDGSLPNWFAGPLPLFGNAVGIMGTGCFGLYLVGCPLEALDFSNVAISGDFIFFYKIVMVALLGCPTSTYEAPLALVLRSHSLPCFSGSRVGWASVGVSFSSTNSSTCPPVSFLLESLCGCFLRFESNALMTVVWISKTMGPPSSLALGLNPQYLEFVPHDFPCRFFPLDFLMVVFLGGARCICLFECKSWLFAWLVSSDEALPWMLSSQGVLVFT
eukprot:Gb_09526 [translate_table: standard]